MKPEKTRHRVMAAAAMCIQKHAAIAPAAALHPACLKAEFHFASDQGLSR
jgi:hypothetical protein